MYTTEEFFINGHPLWPTSQVPYQTKLPSSTMDVLTRDLACLLAWVQHYYKGGYLLGRTH